MRLTTIFLVLLLIIAVTLFSLWTKVPGMISQRMTEKLGVKASISELILGPRSISVENLVIGNVENGILPKAFSAEEIKIQTPITRYLKKDIVIEEIRINNIYLGLEFQNAKGASGNWTEIMKHLESSITPPEKVEEKNKHTLFIKKIILTNINTDVVYRDEGGQVKRLPRIDYMELVNISSEGGFPVDQLMNSVLGQMLQKVFIQQNLKNMIQDIWQQPVIRDQVDKFVPPALKKFLP